MAIAEANMAPLIADRWAGLARTSENDRQHFYNRSAAGINFAIVRRRVEVVAPFHRPRILLESYGAQSCCGLGGARKVVQSSSNTMD